MLKIAKVSTGMVIACIVIIAAQLRTLPAFGAAASPLPPVTSSSSSGPSPISADSSSPTPTAAATSLATTPVMSDPSPTPTTTGLHVPNLSQIPPPAVTSQPAAPRTSASPWVAVAPSRSLLQPQLGAGLTLAISVPGAAVLGTGQVGTARLSSTLGTVTVTTTGGISGLLISWTATVTTSAFTTGTASTSQTIPAERVSYTSGTATAVTGLAIAACTPGQVTPAFAASLATPQTAYACNGLSLLSNTSLSWDPTLSIIPQPTAVVGTYTGSITHSAA